MNPQLNKVFSKLAKEEKTELNSEKVELALIDDLRKAYDRSLSDIKRLEDVIKDLKKAQQNGSSALTGMNISFEKFLNLNLKGEKAAKELGLDFPFNKEYNELFKRSKEAAKEAKKVGIK